MMKKLMTIVMGIVAAMASAAEWTETQIQDAREKLAQETLQPAEKRQIEANLAVLGGDTPANLAEIVERIRPIELKFMPDASELQIEIRALPYACWNYNGKFYAEGYQLAVSRKSYLYIYRFIASDTRNILKLSDADIYAQLMDCLKSSNSMSLLPCDYIPCLEAAMNKAAIIDDATVLADLKKLNRIYTSKLIRDKETWGAVVIAVRTYMDTYK